ncbi:hypothetical protein Psed_6808 (plasmid) [Pseudonocardia dioxanivorans CB1190]|uniref:Uncharacterized protein n=1 Tax=Pseudonocardia dioxanivorans (strain ATCC 55486 / DSM 44775 / JCM 13855 / CB1190) TaxID=675635 RepID=F2L6I5_PSEUX|nr:hypothetical protein [Pseudonocardia dioxanivorans]AEA28879.1 hypothetical protein Psed_6808 [Pseudonocardia dioxanivorans CB1190]
MVEHSARQASGIAAAAALGWRGVVLAPVELFGCRCRPVVELDLEVHRTRRAHGFLPQLDEDVLAIWEWPESDGPAPALTLRGALFPVGRSWRRALGEARRWYGFGPAALLDPTGTACADEDCRWECAFAGVGLVSGLDPGPAVVAAEARPDSLGRVSADRWVEEFLYEAALTAGAFPAE